ncbi:transposase [Lactococcus lactis]|nr:transposase [Lactococcus lactis]
MNHFKGKQFKKDVIIVAVGYYLRYNLVKGHAKM